MQIFLEFELPSETYEVEDKETWKKETRVRLISWQYTLSMHAKSWLRKLVESWLGKKFSKEDLKEGFDIKTMLWKTCQLQVMHNESWEYANIANIMPLIKGTDVPKTDRELVSFFMVEDEKTGEVTDFPEDVFEKLPEWLAKKIMESSEMKKLYWINNDDLEEDWIKMKEQPKTGKTPEEVTAWVAEAKAKSEDKESVKSDGEKEATVEDAKEIME